jgi:hypothetical protein
MALTTVPCAAALVCDRESIYFSVLRSAEKSRQSETLCVCWDATYSTILGPGLFQSSKLLGAIRVELGKSRVDNKAHFYQLFWSLCIAVFCIEETENTLNKCG